MFLTPLNEVVTGILTQLDATGGVIVEYAMLLFVPRPTATHVPFA